MASKSKRRRKVLGASCILAALIIAGSSFAWFTSKDEVTNRLTANADYGVSIVESFAPPKNWLPGQTVNKDVYDVNTGNIAAFVKNNISGKLSYTYESKVPDFSTDCIKLNELQVQAIDGVTTNESGGFLAWTDVSGVDVGAVNAARNDDNVSNTWRPTARGTYIFRRAIGGTSSAPTYTYAGYYFDGTNNYYKIVIGDDKYRAEKTDTTVNPNGVEFDLATPEAAITGIRIDRKDGSFTGTPKIWYVKDTKVNDDAVNFKLDETGKRLIVEYASTLSTVTEGTDPTTTYDASADAARKEVAYTNQLGISNSAIIDYNQANADYVYSYALTKATNDLYKAARDRKDAADAYSDTADNGSRKKLDTEWGNLATKVETVAGTYNTAKGNFIGYDTLIPDEVKNVIFADGSTLEQCKSNYNKMKTLDEEIKALDLEIGAKFDELRKATDKLSGKQVESIIRACEIKLGTMKGKITEYSNAFAGIVADPAVTSHLNTGEANTQKTQLDGIASTIQTGQTGLIGSMDTEITAYKNAWDTNESKKADDAAAGPAWRDAVIAYNTAVEKAQSDYQAAMAQTPPSPTAPEKTSAYNSNNDDIVSNYAATGTLNGDPKIDLNTATTGTNYTTYAIADKTYPAETDRNGKYDTMDVEIGKTNTAKSAYDNAVQVLDSSSKITIYVNLDKNYSANWTMDKSTDNTNTVKFYLNSILDAGKTTAKLVDSVEFANTVTAKDYKNLTFDLNVGLDSAQIVYADDEKTILPTAVDASNDFVLKAAVANAPDANGVIAVTWTDGTTTTGG